MTRNAGRFGLVGALVGAARSEGITFLAAGLAYYAFVSLIPLLLLVLVVATVLGGDALAAQLVASVGAVLSPSGEEVLREALTSETGRGSATVVGIAVLLWGTLKVFRGLDVAFSQVYGTDDDLSFLGQVKSATVALLAVGAGVAISVVVGLLVGFSGLPLVTVLGPLALVVGLVLAFLPLYVVLPGADVGVGEALPGALLAAVGWTVLGTVFQLYAENVAALRLYGLVGALLLLVTWFYLGGILLLLGGVLNAVLAGRLGEEDLNRQLQQEPIRGGGQRSMTDDHGGSPPPATDDGDGDGDREQAQEQDQDQEQAKQARTDEIAELRAELESFEAEIEDRTLHRDEVERDLERYVRRRVRRGHARGWGPYLVLLYGTAMTLGAFFWLNGGWAILAMLVIWLSTLGLFVLMLLVGVTFTAAGVPGRLRDRIQEFRR